jgi:hypothetical protein
MSGGSDWLAVLCGEAMPGSKGPRLGFVMYPAAKTDEDRLDS